jgi:nucleotide-binding universal stress UspA family protein
MYDRILVPTDGSDCARAAADHAIELAREHGATVYALHVLHLRPSLEPNVEAVLDALEATGEEALDDVARRGADAGVEVVTEMEKGVPNEVVRAVAEREGADLIVMGTHGLSGLERFLLGSTTERVLRLSSVPVLTVGRDSADDDSDGGARE